MDETAYFAYDSETGEHLEVLPFDECIKIIQYRYNNIKESLNNACETNKRLKEEHYKDELVNGLKKQLSQMEDAYYRGFPITKEDKEAFEYAVECMKFTKDFYSLEVTPERAKHALNLLNALEYAVNIHFAR